LGKINLVLSLTSSSKTERWYGVCGRRSNNTGGVKLKKLIPLDLWPQNSPDLNPVNYQILGVMQDRVYHTPVEDVTDV